MSSPSTAGRCAVRSLIEPLDKNGLSSSTASMLGFARSMTQACTPGASAQGDLSAQPVKSASWVECSRRTAVPPGQSVATQRQV
jgi:hypothetical protein